MSLPYRTKPAETLVGATQFPSWQVCRGVGDNAVKLLVGTIKPTFAVRA
jgi:hypothetical protein